MSLQHYIFAQIQASNVADLHEVLAVESAQ